MNCTSCSAELAARATFCANCGARVEDPFIGQVIEDRYQIENKIADGGFGAIYRGTQLMMQRPVAVKVMHEDVGADGNLVARFRREGQVLCNLRDAHTVTTYELGETPEGRMYIVMELLEGKTLLEVGRTTGALPWPRMLAIARQICSALAEAHALGIVHRDLKPANIYLENRTNHADYVKVLDFGIAKLMQGSGIGDGSELTVMGQAVGTLEYMAPEQLMGGKCDGRTDIYTLGVVAYEMICGRRPFADVAGLDLLTEQLTRRPPAPSELAAVPAIVDHVLLRCLEQDAADRFPDVTALAAALDDALLAARTSAGWPQVVVAQEISEPVLTISEAPDTVIQTIRDTEPHPLADRGPETIIQSFAPDLPAPDLRPRWNVVAMVTIALIAIGIGAAFAFWL